MGRPARDTSVGRSRPLRLVWLAVQVAAVAAVIWLFEIHNLSFRQLFVALVPCFAIHALLPLRLRAPFFLLVSLAGFAFVLGLRNTALLVGFGVLLIALCHAPLRWSGRVLAVAIAGAALAAARTGWIEISGTGALWPVLGSIFMFRLAVYLYDTHHEREHAPLAQRLAYFFAAPNAVFLLFPVIDYGTFRRNYYAGDPHVIYQTGVRWMTRGIVHLLLYRLVYVHATIPPSEVLNPAQVVQYIVSTFLLYLQISGQFHLIVGTLHLFGFKLPETNHLYYLASSFTDFWRRINIYWKDFMRKLVYYPIALRLRHRGQVVQVVLGTSLVFVLSWLLHSYQWFWLRGSFPIRATDVLFWGGLGALAVINGALEARPRQRRASGERSPLMRSLGLALRTFAVFSAIAILWSIWTADSLGDWRALVTTVEPFRWRDVTLTQVLLVGGVLVMIAASPLLARGGALESLISETGRGIAWVRQGVPAVATLAVLLACGSPALDRVLGTPAERLLASIRSPRLSKADLEQEVRGYYEDLVHVERFNTELWRGQHRRPIYMHIFGSELGARRRTNDLLMLELAPSVNVPWKLKRFSTNRWAMRDRDYELEKAPGTVRIAFLGASHVMGWGVADDETFESLIEDQLNASAGDGRRWELLNFGVSGYSPLQKMIVFERRALLFDPDAVVYVAHGREINTALRSLAQAVRSEVEIHYPFLSAMVERAAVDKEMTEQLVVKRLRPEGSELVSWIYAQIQDRARKNGVRTVWIYLPDWVDRPDAAPQDLVALARGAGFEVVDLGNIFADQDPEELRVAPWDQHPNEVAHRHMAEGIRAALAELGIVPGADEPQPTDRASAR